MANVIRVGRTIIDVDEVDLAILQQSANGTDEQLTVQFKSGRTLISEHTASSIEIHGEIAKALGLTPFARG